MSALGTPPRKGSAAGQFNLPPISHPCRAQVYCDGQHLRGVLAYDCDKGWVATLAYGDDGKPLMDDDSFRTAIRRGAVEVKYR